MRFQNSCASLRQKVDPETCWRIRWSKGAAAGCKHWVWWSILADVEKMCGQGNTNFHEGEGFLCYRKRRHQAPLFISNRPSMHPTLDRDAVKEREYSACRKLQHLSPRLCNFYFIVGNSLAPMQCRLNGAIWDNDNKDNMNTKSKSSATRLYCNIDVIFLSTSVSEHWHDLSSLGNFEWWVHHDVWIKRRE